MPRIPLTGLPPCFATWLVLIAPLAPSPSLAHAQWQGEIAFGGRTFQQSGASGDSSSTELDLVLRPRASVEWDDGAHRLDIEPFLRLDLLSGGRTRFDLRALSWVGAWDEWVLYAGMREVFWGVTESWNVVDILNQRRPVGDYEGYEKLGQAMVGLQLMQGWGTIEAVILPWFRERDFEGRAGLLWSPLAVDVERASFESGAGARHVDWAIRWAHTIGDVDLALSHFAGTSREPRFEQGLNGSESEALVPYYDLTDQTGMEIQWTEGPRLWKLEAMSRSSPEGRYGAGVAGLEYSFAEYLGMIVEYALDTRGGGAMASFEHDLYLGGRLLMQEGQVLAGIFVDTRSGNRIFGTSVRRRLGDRFTVDLEARWFGGNAKREPRHALRQESFLSAALTTYF